MPPSLMSARAAVGALLLVVIGVFGLWSSRLSRDERRVAAPHGTPTTKDEFQAMLQRAMASELRDIETASREMQARIDDLRRRDGRPEVAGRRPIPKTIFLVWKSRELNAEAKKVDTIWRLNEPGYERRIVTDEECRELAAAYPNMLKPYDNLPSNVMRADVCRVLVVYAYGGIYMDLDVEFVKPLDQWLDLSGPSPVIGHEQESLYTNWFFAARKGDSCLAIVLNNTIELLRRAAGPSGKVKLTFRNVMSTTGPFGFTQGVRKCGYVTPRYDGEQMTYTLIKHAFASLSWNGKEYTSWTDNAKAASMEKLLIRQWRRNSLPLDGPIREASREWRHLKSFERSVISDARCMELLSVNPRLNLTDRLLVMLPLNVMRARMCALVSVIVSGGAHMDLDVVPGSTDNAAGLEWASAPLGKPLFGWAAEGVVAPWFFAAAAWDPVVRCVLGRTVEALERAETTYEAGWAGYETVEALVAVVENTTGAAGFTRAVLECGGKPRLSTEEMGGGLLRHLGASRAWAKRRHSSAADPHAYRSWRVEARRQVAPRFAVIVVDSGTSAEEPLRGAFERTNPRWNATVLGTNALQGGAVPDECPGSMGAAARLFCSALLKVAKLGGGVVYGGRGIDPKNPASMEPLTAAAALRGSGLHVYMVPGAARGSEIAGAVAVVHPDSKALECTAAFASRLGSWDEAAAGGLASTLPTCADAASLVTVPSVAPEWA